MIKVIAVDSPEQFEKEMDALNKETATIYENEKQRALNQCTNENIKTIFLDWWNGKSVYTEEYESKYSREDHYDAHSIILEVISNGFG
jgi:hypothetical protein